MKLSRKLRARFYYSIPVAGAQVGWGRSDSYRAAERGDIPTENVGRFKLVPRKPWDRKKKRILRGPATRPSRRPAAEA
jgi:hypothetical protein